MSNPKVSVLMSVYNGECYLREAIISILNQTFQDFEFIIIDDGSTDSSRDIIDSFGDPKISVFENDRNLGLTKSLNKGIDLCRGQYIARMDADDISLRERLEKQKNFMDRNEEIGICGTWTKTIGEKSGEIRKYPIHKEDIRCNLLFNNALCHSTLFFRKDALFSSNLKYDTSFRYSQDFDLMVRASAIFPLANIPEVLLLYRIHFRQIAETVKEQQVIAGNKIRESQLANFQLEPTIRQMSLHFNFIDLKMYVSRKIIDESHDWLLQLKKANDKTGFYDSKVMTKFLAYLWLRLCNASVGLGWWIWRRFRSSPFIEGTSLANLKIWKFFAKCFIKWPSNIISH